MMTAPRWIDFRLHLSLACLLLGLYLLVYVPKINSADGEAILAVTASTLRHGLPDIGVIGAGDALQPFDMSRMGSFGQDGAYYSKKGVVPSVVLVPLVLLAELLPWLDTRATAMLLNPLVTTATGMLLYTFARWLDFRPRTAFLVALLYGVATFAITYVKTLFGEPLATLLLLGAVMMAYRYQQAGIPRTLVLAGLFSGLMLGVNLVYVAVVPVLAVYLFMGRTVSRASLRALILYSLPVISILALIGFYNWARFGSPTNTGYHFAAGEGFTKPLLEGVFGLTIGPYRGLFWYSPILLLAFPGWLMLRRQTSRLAWLILALVVLQILSFASWWSWDGGIIWGPRFLLPVIPLIALSLAPLVTSARTKPGIALLMICLTLLSLAIQLLGAIYSFYPYIAYLYQHYYVPELPGLAAEVQFNPGLSAILGHLALALNRWPLEPAWAANGVDGIHLMVSLALLALGVGTAVYQMPRSDRGLLLVVTVGIVVGLNVVVARQQGSREAAAIRDLETVLQPAGMVVAATTHFGESLVDIDNGSWVVSTNAPTTPDDPLAGPMWDFATVRGGNLWLLTWFAPHDPANWQERDLWRRAAFAYERQSAGHRAMLFSLHPAPALDRGGGYSFGGLTLNRYGIAQTADGLLVSVEWSAVNPVSQNYSWFIHVIDEAGNVLAQQDRPPDGGYSPTSTWIPNETQVIDRLYFPGVSGSGLYLRVGWVNPVDGERLPAFDAHGDPLTDGFALLSVDE